MSELYDILEKCLQEIEKGADLDSMLFRYPAYASELRPILETAMKAIRATAPDPSTAVVQRNRARLLQQAAEIREANAHKKARRLWAVPLRRVLVTLVVVAALFVSSTGLVRAASSTLPGDNLYPVKRTWEDVHVLLTFDTQTRAALEVEHENERLNELKNLFAAQRSVLVDFSGQVTRQSENLLLVSGIAVAISSQTALPAASIAVGNAIHVVGTTQQDGAVLAQRVELLPAGEPLPEVKDEDSFSPAPENSDNASGGDASNPGENPASTSKPKYQSFQGDVQSINGNIWVVNGQIMNVASARIKGNPRVGKSAKVAGYYDANGLFIVTRVEFGNGGSGNGGNSNNGGGSGNGGGDDNKPPDGGGGDDHSGSDGGSGGGGGGSDDGGSGWGDRGDH